MQGTITNAEWQIMRVAWTLGQVTSTQLIEILQQKTDWQPATVKTLLRRLVAKGALKTHRQGRAFVYEPIVKEQATINEATDDLFNSICGMHVGQALAHVVENATLTQADIQLLQDLLAKKANQAPTQVPCNCVPGMRCDD